MEHRCWKNVPRVGAIFDHNLLQITIKKFLEVFEFEFVKMGQAEIENLLWKGLKLKLSLQKLQKNYVKNT